MALAAGGMGRAVFRIGSFSSEKDTRCLHRWRISRESRSVGHWSGNRRFWRREDQNQEVDRTSGQQRCRVCCSSRSAAIGFRPWRQNTPCVFRFRSRGQADDRRIRLSQLATLFSTLDLPKIGPFARVLHIAHSSRKQRRSQSAGQFRRPAKGERKGFGHAYDRLNSHGKDDLCPRAMT